MRIATGITILFCVSILALAVIMNERYAAAQDPLSVPLTSTRVIKHFDAAGVQTATEVFISGVRDDGSRVDERHLMNGKVIGVRAIQDVKTRRRVVVDPITQSTTTYKLDGDEVAFYRSLGRCVAPAAAEWRSLLGRAVFKSTASTVTGSSEIRRESWISPELGCTELSARAELYHAGVLAGSREEEVIDVRLGAPDHDLFTVPASYVERPPSQVFSESHKIQGTACPACEMRTGTELDAVYRSRQ